MGEFSEKVYAVVCQIPRGKVSTYGQVARLIGSARSARYVGFALRNNPNPSALEFAKRFQETASTFVPTCEATSSSNEESSNIPALIPCHRVIFGDGRLCNGFAFGGPDVQRLMLEEEGVTFVDNDHVDLDACLWDGHLTMLTGNDLPESAPTAPPPGFDWAAELGE